MNREYFHRYRFYEIIRAHIEGKDLSEFTPKNNIEAKLINDLKNITSGGSSEVPVYKYNNPELKGLYYSLIPANGFKKFVFDFPKFAKAFAEYGLSNNNSYTLDSWPSKPYKANYIAVHLMDVYPYGNQGSFKPGINIYETYLEIANYGVTNSYIKLDYNSDLHLNEKYPEYFQTYSMPTLEMIFNEIGRIEIDITSMDPSYISCMISHIYLPNIHGPQTDANLNEHPIDYMWFE